MNPLAAHVAALIGADRPEADRGPRPGDLVVYGWDDRNRDRIRQAGEIGHIGILSFVPGVELDSRIVEEARRWVGQGVYGLGRGGRNPRDGTPFDAHGRCDWRDSSA